MKENDNHQIIVENFNKIKNWEEKYIYLIELGNTIKNSMPKKYYKNKYQIYGCQSKVWICVLLTKKEKSILKFYGDSDSSIVRGLIALVFLFYKNISIKNIINFNIYKYLKKMNLSKFLTFSRSQGLKSIIKSLIAQVNNIIISSFNNKNQSKKSL